MIKNKKGLVFSKAIVSLIIISMVIVGIGIWVNEWSDKYDSGIDYDLGNYNKLDTLSSYATSTQGELSTKSSFDTTSAGDFEGTSIRGAFAVINDIFTPFNVLFGDGGMLSSIQDRWHIPNYIMISFISIMIIYIIFALIALFFRRTDSTT